GLGIGLVMAFLVVTVVALIYGLVGDSLAASLQPVALHPRAGQTPPSTDADRVKDGIHLATGLAYDAKAFKIVRAVCTNCHSAKLVTQNRATRAGWKEMIRWMQATQDLWDLGGDEDLILDYLAKYYAPEAVGRRAALEEVEFYILELD
ncbi:MAG: hypothetical protein AAFZ52_19130, partial [Bacteroidota bacterium]